MFAVLDDVILTTVDIALAAEDDGSRMSLFDRAILNHGLNLLEASRILLASGHWEVASSAARQLFELLVNMEYIAQQPDRESACFRYQKFALLQMALRVRREIEYDRATGRPVNEERAKLVADLLDGPSFEEFRTRNGKWNASWSGQSTRALAEQSPVQMRAKQWEQLFVTWSEETHAAPVALLDAMMPRDQATWIETQVADDDREVGQVILMLVVLYLELCGALPNAPALAPEKRLKWTHALMKEVPAPSAFARQPRGGDEVG